MRSAGLNRMLNCEPTSISTSLFRNGSYGLRLLSCSQLKPYTRLVPIRGRAKLSSSIILPNLLHLPVDRDVYAFLSIFLPWNYLSCKSTRLIQVNAAARNLVQKSNVVPPHLCTFGKRHPALPLASWCESRRYICAGEVALPEYVRLFRCRQQ
ncbi:hypothetical protein GJ744_011776 [Endocarpon pusillum]|uniref:Uncharacterized protein n=1 Tax=Endocarpon pusillum TaxID=364733 RepID=A0A8H7AG64_9EURO|nr:hypothetical protein GJ744_011776 [Endocarpon pusillum]